MFRIQQDVCHEPPLVLEHRHDSAGRDCYRHELCLLYRVAHVHSMHVRQQTKPRQCQHEYVSVQCAVRSAAAAATDAAVSHRAAGRRSKHDQPKAAAELPGDSPLSIFNIYICSCIFSLGLFLVSISAVYLFLICIVT